ncbi:MAG: Fic family protein [Acidimicrobiales bacterium]
MDLGAFESSPTGHLVPIEVRQRGETVPYYAFLPAPLPDDPLLSSSTWAAIVHAASTLAELRTLAEDRLPDPLLIGRVTVRREAVSTSALEGTYAPARQVLSSEMDEASPRDAGVVEILNYVRAWDDAVASTLPVCVRLACELQGRLVRGTPSEDYQTGSVRQTQVLIGPYRGCSIQESTYVPPPPGADLEAGLSSWEKWLNESACHDLVKVALGHYQFEALHPFTDGNGRIGRLLAILQLIHAGLLPGPLVNLSPYFEQRSEEYRHRLRSVSTHGAIDEWIQFFCEAIANQATEAQERIRRLLSWRDETVEVLRANGRKGSVVDLVPFLIEYPVITVKQAKSLLGVSNPSANGAVNALESMGILVETTGGNYNRVFEAPAVLDVIFGP